MTRQRLSWKECWREAKSDATDEYSTVVAFGHACWMWMFGVKR